MVAWVKVNACRCYADTYRNAVGKALSRCDNVGNNSRMLISKERTSPSDAGLDLIHDKQDFSLGADSSNPHQESLGRDVDSCLSLDGLHDDCSCFGSYS